MINHWNTARRKEARKRWSLNAVRAKERKRVEWFNAEWPDEPPVKVFIPKRSKPDLKVCLERKDGMRIQFTLHYFYGKLIGQNVQMSPKQFGRKLGDIFQLWTTA